MLELVDAAQASGGEATRRTTTWVGRSIRVLLVDEEPVVHEGVRQFLSGSDHIRSVDVACSGNEALAAARAGRHDVVLVDSWLSDMMLEVLVRRLVLVSPGSRVMIFTAQVSPSLLDEARALGVNGILGRGASHERLLEAIAQVAVGRTVFDPGIDRMLQRAAEKVNGMPLTRREHEILRRAAHGESNAEIAGAIYLAPTTVKSYLQSALRKLGARNRVEAVFKLSELRIL